jgi:hypothetical protein
MMIPGALAAVTLDDLLQAQFRTLFSARCPQSGHRVGEGLHIQKTNSKDFEMPFRFLDLPGEL